MGIADVLITRGWNQGKTVGPDGSVCLLGATGCALSGAAHSWTEVEDLERLFPSLLQEGDCDWARISSWNDQPGRTFDEVLRVAKEADELLSE